MTNLIECIIKDLKDGIDNYVHIYENPVKKDSSGMIVWAWVPTRGDFTASYQTRVRDQIRPLMSSLNRDNPKGKELYEYANVIKRRLENIARLFENKEHDLATREEIMIYGRKLKKLQNSVDYFYELYKQINLERVN